MIDGLGLRDAYGATIERIKSQGGGKWKLWMEASMWISHAERPLTVHELCDALAIEPGSIDFNADNVPSIETLVGCCQGLITVDKEGSTVRLIHFTLQEYLSAHPDIFTRPHAAIAEISLTYLNCGRAKAISTDILSIPNRPFLKYRPMYRGVHAKREPSDCARSLALKLLQEYDDHIWTVNLLEKESPGFSFATRVPFNGLHCASLFGIVDVVTAFIEMRCYDLNERDFGGRTPLLWATKKGHEVVAKIPLAQEKVDPNRPNNRGQTPLSFAVWRGCEEVVKILLGREGVNPDKPDEDGITPLLYAAPEGYERIVRILFTLEEVDPDKPDDDGMMPLLYAASEEYEGIVRILLARREVNPDKPSDHGDTPLSSAAQRGHEDVVKILLERKEVNREKLNNDGDTPLTCAAYRGHEGMVKILLEQEGVSPDNLNRASQTPVSYACWEGHEGVVKILLEQEEISPNKADSDGQTPLMYETGHGHREVIELLQPHEAIPHDALSGIGDTTP